MTIGLLIQIMWANTTLLTIMYVTGFEFYITILIKILYFVPSFHFLNPFMSMVDITGTRFNMKSFLWEK